MVFRDHRHASVSYSQAYMSAHAEAMSLPSSERHIARMTAVWPGISRGPWTRTGWDYPPRMSIIGVVGWKERLRMNNCPATQKMRRVDDA